jgi:hypothetical protein
MKNLFQKQKPTTGLGGLVQNLRRDLNTTGGASFVESNVSQAAISMESMTDAVSSNLQSSINRLETCLQQIMQSGKSMGLEQLTESAQQAGVVAGVMSGDINAWMRQKRTLPASSEFDRYIGSNAGVDRLSQAMEAYDEKENKNAAVYSVAYNMQAARQDEFGEALYPTVTVTPDQVGYTVSVHLVQVYNEVRRAASGALNDFRRRNIIHAVRDPSILQNDLTKIVPIHAVASQANFVDTTILTPRTVLLGDESLTTSALAFAKKFSLLGISQSAALLATGQQDSTDAIDTAVRLGAVYMHLFDANGANPDINEIIKFTTADLPMATFNHAVQGNYRLMQLNFTTSSLKVDSATKLVTGADSVILAGVATGSYTVRLGVTINGSVNMETADTELLTGAVTVVSVMDEDNVSYAPTDSAVSAIVALFTSAKLVGYDLDARRTNSNRRQRGQLLDVTVYNQTFAVPLLAPITVPRPLGQGDNTDASDLAALITATRIRTSNAAVTELLRVRDLLQAYVNNNDAIGNSPEILGVARFLVDPFFEEISVDIADITNSIKSAEKDADIQGALVSLIRSLVYRMYRDSGYKPAADALNGGVAQTPTVIIGTDPVLARYLSITGDPRLLGGDSFNVKIVSSLDIRVIGKIFVTFGAAEGATSGTPNPMQFGNMAWKPELTMVLPLHRNGANSKELTVQPSFLHITNLPVLGVINVTGLAELASAKTSIDFNEV